MKDALVPAQTSASSATVGVPALGGRLGVEDALTEALPIPDLAFGGGMLVLVIMFHAFWIRLIAGAFLKRARSAGFHRKLWRADLLFASSVVALLSLHMAEIFLWTASLIAGDIVSGWARAGYYAANCYTALGEPFNVADAWRMVPPIIAMSGIFTFAWTASVLVNFVARYNDLRSHLLVVEEPSADHPPP